jgi:hypothetical protein
MLCAKPSSNTPYRPNTEWAREFGVPVETVRRALIKLKLTRRRRPAAAGDRLAFGSTTGGLWVSDDQGDSWACATHTLPPIYSVRFA